MEISILENGKMGKKMDKELTSLTQQVWNSLDNLEQDKLLMENGYILTAHSSKEISKTTSQKEMEDGNFKMVTQ